MARHAELTQLLLERGADPNDEETPYHVPESYDNTRLSLLIASGRLTPDSLATMLLRKADWHDVEGMRLLLAHGADPNRPTVWKFTALQQAVRRDNELSCIVSLLDAGGDPVLTHDPEQPSARSIAACRGRGDVLAVFARRGVAPDSDPYLALLAACAMDDGAAIDAITASEPALRARVLANGGDLLAKFAGNGNTRGVEQLLDLGVSVTARYLHGDGYFGVAAYSTALHVAAWRARHDTVASLLARGADVHARDARDCTALMLAVRACVDSYWTARRETTSIGALLAAGANASDIRLPTGYDDADALLQSWRR